MTQRIPTVPKTPKTPLQRLPRSTQRRLSSPLVLCLGLAAFAACNNEAAPEDDGSIAGASGSGGKKGSGGSEPSVGGQGDAGSQSGDGGAEASGGSRPSGGNEGLAGGGGASGEEAGGNGSGGAPVGSCVDELELAPPLERWTAYVVENPYGQPTLWAAKSGAPDAAIVLHESEHPLTSLSWSPDGRFLAFVDHDGGEWASSLYVIDFSGEQPSAVIPVAVSGGYEVVDTPRWSPDSRRLVYAETSSAGELRLVDFSTGEPAAPVVFGRNCPQGAYAEMPCLASFIQPLVLEWSPTGDDLALLFVSTFFADFGTGSAADLFVLDPGQPDTPGTFASLFVPSFSPARRGVALQTFAWSPDGARVAYAGSFEDTSSVAEAYVFNVSGDAAVPIKLHADLAAPNEGTRSRVVWASETMVLFASDLNAPAEHELFALDVSDPNAVGFPDSKTLLSASGGSILTFSLSPDRNSLLVLRPTSEEGASKLTIFPYENAPLTGALELSSKVATVGSGWRASAQWSADSGLVAFVEEDDELTRLSIAGLLKDGSPCRTSSLDVDSPAETWHWLARESSVVVLDATGVHRLHAGSQLAEHLSAPLEVDESIGAWAVQPLGDIE